MEKNKDGKLVDLQSEGANPVQTNGQIAIVKFTVTHPEGVENNAESKLAYKSGVEEIAKVYIK